MSREKAAFAGHEVLEKIRRIQEEADTKKMQYAKELKATIEEKRRELASLEETYNEITGGHLGVRKVDGRRMTSDLRESLIGKLPGVLGSARMKRSDIIAGLGIADNQWNTIRKAAGKKLKMYGSKANAEYAWDA